MYIFEQGEHVISAAFEIKNYGNRPDIYDSDMYNYYRANNRHDKKNIYYGSEEMTIPEGYELVNVSTVGDEELIYTFVNKCKVKVSLYASLAIPGKPVDTISKRLVKNDLGR